MLETGSPVIGFVHLAKDPSATLADDSLKQTFARLSGRCLGDAQPYSAPRIAASRFSKDRPRTVLPSVTTGCVRVQVLIRPADVSRVDANVDQLDKDLSVEAADLADRITAMSQAG